VRTHLIMGFRDDVVIRVRAEPDATRIDARLSSRYGSFRSAPTPAACAA
jgi:hypothetical protein